MDRKTKRKAIRTLADQAQRNGTIEVPVGLGESIARELEKRQGKLIHSAPKWEDVKGVTDKMVTPSKNRLRWLKFLNKVRSWMIKILNMRLGKAKGSPKN